MTEHDKAVQAEIEQAHKQQLQFMNLMKKSSSLSPSIRKTQRKLGGNLRKKGGFVRHAISNAASSAKDLSTLATSLVMIYRGNSPEAINGFVDKYASDSLKKRILVAGKDAEKISHSISVDKSLGKSLGKSLSKSLSKSRGGSRSVSRSRRQSQTETDESEKEHDGKDDLEDVYTGEKNEKGEKHGTGKMEYSNGNVYEGQWKNNMRNGKGKITFVNKSSYDGTWSKDQITGKGIFTYFNGDVYGGAFDKGVKSGFGKMTFRNGDVYEGHWKKNRREGEGKMDYKNGDKFVGNWHKDLREGEGRLVDTAGKVLEEGVYENDEPPFSLNASKVGNVKTEINSVLDSVGTTFDEVVNSEGSKKIQKAMTDFKASLPDVPDLETVGKYSLSLFAIVDVVYYAFRGCGEGKTELQSCKLLSSFLAVAVQKFDQAGNILVNSFPILLYLVGVGAAGFLFLMLFGTWQYLNKPHEDSKKTTRKR